MFEVAETFLIDLINCMPVLIPLVLIMNLIYEMLWGEK